VPIGDVLPTSKILPIEANASATLSFSQHETFARLIDWYVAAEPEYGSRL